MTGDTLVLTKRLKDDVLSSVDKLKAPLIPQPMFFCTIEPDSSGQQEGMVCCDMDNYLLIKSSLCRKNDFSILFLFLNFISILN